MIESGEATVFLPDSSIPRNSRSDTSAIRLTSRYGAITGSLSVNSSFRKRYSIVTASARVQVFCASQRTPCAVSRPWMTPEPTERRMASFAQPLTGSSSLKARRAL